LHAEHEVPSKNLPDGHGVHTPPVTVPKHLHKFYIKVKPVLHATHVLTVFVESVLQEAQFAEQQLIPSVLVTVVDGHKHYPSLISIVLS
jgi:hypothetical protein